MPETKMIPKIDICDRCDGDGYIYQVGKNQHVESNGLVCPKCKGRGKVLVTSIEILQTSNQKGNLV
jgi:DnaJ-class molecular chaperone